jgi:hypothetical protein
MYLNLQELPAWSCYASEQFIMFFRSEEVMKYFRENVDWTRHPSRPDPALNDRIRGWNGRNWDRKLEFPDGTQFGTPLDSNTYSKQGAQALLDFYRQISCK